MIPYQISKIASKLQKQKLEKGSCVVAWKEIFSATEATRKKHGKSKTVTAAHFFRVFSVSLPWLILS
jgi:hypothetical protein